MACSKINIKWCTKRLKQKKHHECLAGLSPGESDTNTAINA